VFSKVSYAPSIYNMNYKEAASREMERNCLVIATRQPLGTAKRV
jgi:hypothetical protein